MTDDEILELAHKKVQELLQPAASAPPVTEQQLLDQTAAAMGIPAGTNLHELAPDARIRLENRLIAGAFARGASPFGRTTR